jgi:hypothetical protein
MLILGVVQWSFLTVLIQGSWFAGRTAVEVSPGHSSKFAATFKSLIGNFGSLQTCLGKSSYAVLRPHGRLFQASTRGIFQATRSIFFPSLVTVASLRLAARGLSLFNLGAKFRPALS